MNPARFRQLFLVSPLLLLAGCGAFKPSAPTPLPDSVVASAMLGNPIGLTATSPSGAVAIQATLFAVQNVPDNVGEPIAAKARLITADASREPVAAAVPAAERVRMLNADLIPPDDASVSPTFGQLTLLQSQVVVAPTSGTVTMSLASSSNTQLTSPVRISIGASGFAGNATPLLMVRAEPSVSKDDLVAAGEAPPSSQTLLIDWPILTSDGVFGLLIPRTQNRADGMLLLKLHAIDVANDPKLTSIAEAVFNELAPTTQPTAAPSTGRRQLAMVDALEKAKTPGAMKRTLAYVCLDAGADVAGELAALSDNADALALLVDATKQALVATPPRSNTSGLAGWILDRAAMITAAKLAGDGKLSRAASAGSSARYGEVGRDPNGLAALASASATREDFTQRLRAEHLVLLDDASPASRVCAFDWLSNRNLAPPNYDPLAPRKQRSAALDAFMEKQQAATTTAP
ncbi:MAG: hypothetical protein QM770_07000 [Tepidisphaeraceae bacterium]